MGNNFKVKFNWIAVAAIFAFLLGVVNTIMLNRTKEVRVCTIDVWEISNKKVLEIAQDALQDSNQNTQSQEQKQSATIQTQQQVLLKLNEYLKKVNAKLSNPSDYGCSFIAIKGSVVQSKNVKDITEAIMKDVK
ncbi:hypothetical protein [Thermodesulfovibrio sp. TK110]